MLNSSDSLMIFVVDKIISDIYSGILKKGEYLISKRKLAIKYNVSRTVIDRAIEYLVAKGYLSLTSEGLYLINNFNRYKDIEDLINFSKFQNRDFTNLEIENIRQLKNGLDLLAIKLITLPLKEELYLKLKEDLSPLNLDCSFCQNKNCAECATIIYNFYSKLAQLSNNNFLNLLYFAFKDTNIIIITNYLNTHNINALYKKALLILNYLYKNNRNEAIKLINKDIH